MRAATLALTLAAMLLSGSALAGSGESSEDIVVFTGARQACPSRGICVGTEDECKSKAEAAPAQTGLDMLINFDLDSISLTPDAQTKLAEFAKALKDNRLKALTFVVEGHTDATGSATYNEGLSERRAESVTAFLLSSGIEQSRISAVGMGETHPRNANPYDPSNRRVEMRLNQ